MPMFASAQLIKHLSVNQPPSKSDNRFFLLLPGVKKKKPERKQIEEYEKQTWDESKIIFRCL